MTDESRKHAPDEGDPLSATAMFLRALDAKPNRSDAAVSKPEPIAPSKAEGTRDAASSPLPPRSGGPGEFTQIFSKSSPASHPAGSPGPEPPRTAHLPSVEPGKAGLGSTAAQSPGEFTRIFVKDAGTTPKPVSKTSEEKHPDVVPVRPKGFSTPGASDAVSAETSFSQIFRPVGKGPTAPAPADPPLISPLRSQPQSPSTPVEPAGSRFPHGHIGPEKNDSSITGLIESLSSPPQQPSTSRLPEASPYRAEPLPQSKPAARPSAPQADPGGVTQFIRKLTDQPPAPPIASAPVPPPVHTPVSEPGEFTRIISRPAVDPALAASAASVPPASSAAAPPARLAIPTVPVPHIAVPAVPAVPAAVIPTAPKPAIPAAPIPLAAPKSKLESMVPILLVVNTFLLLVLLVIVIFLAKAR